MTHKRKFSWWIVPAAAIAVLAGLFIWFRAHPVVVQAQGASFDLSKLTTTRLQLGTVSVGVGATGTLSTSQSASLSWQTDGQVAQVFVKKGDPVQANQMLAQVNPASSPNLVTAQANLLAAQQNLATLENVAVAQAQAQVALANAATAVANDQAKLDALSVPPTQAEIAGAQYVVLNDQARVANLQDAYNRTLGLLPRTIRGRTVRSQAQIDIQQANALAALQAEIQKLNQDQAALAAMQNFTPDPGLVAAATDALAIAKAQLASAQATWDSLKNGSDPIQITAAQAQIDSIQAAINQQYLRAPFAGTVTNLAVKPNDLVSPGTFALEIDNLSPLYVTLQVSEVDINAISVGQPVDLSFDAAPDKAYTGQVTGVSSNGVVTNGVANFSVTVQLVNPDSQIKPGMTVTADIITGSVSNVLVAPLRAVVKAGSTNVVYVLVNGAVQPVTVTIGLTSDTQLQLISTSLKPGDVIVTNPSVLATAVSQPQGLSIFNGLFKSFGLVTSNKASATGLLPGAVTVSKIPAAGGSSSTGSGK